MVFLNIVKNVFDVLSLAAILFFIYRFAVKRKAVKLALGVVLFLLVMLVVDAAKLNALSFVFENFRQLGVIAILIIFQPELRSALDKIGGSTFDKIQNINHVADKKPVPVSPHKVVDAIALAAEDLAKINHGALIVIEREYSLEEQKKSGAKLDSEVTPEALKSIFYKGAPLHDGAAIIRNGRIDYARCVLPLTERYDISSELGTRHRAAIGVTENTDAIVVIVSEESGTISLSVNGELERGFTYVTLCARLDGLLNPNEKKKNRNRNRKNYNNKNYQKNAGQKNGSASNKS